MIVVDVDPKPAWDVVDVTCDLARFVEGGRTIASVTWVVLPEGLTSTELALNGSIAGLRVGGGTPHQVYELHCRAAFTDGRRETTIIRMRVLP